MIAQTLFISVIMVSYGMALWHFVVLLKEVYSNAPPPPKDHNLLRLWIPNNETNRFYPHALFFEPSHRRPRSRMYGYATIGFVVLISYALSGIDKIPT